MKQEGLPLRHRIAEGLRDLGEDCGDHGEG
jgi:hypothetical protein